jgi:hypothetical protein
MPPLMNRCEYLPENFLSRDTPPPQLVSQSPLARTCTRLVPIVVVDDDDVSVRESLELLASRLVLGPAGRGLPGNGLI